MLDSLPVESRTKAFFDCWTRKEAYVKGRGEGLTLPLEQFSVSIDPTQPIGLIENRVHPADVSLWSLQGIDPGPGYAAAIAVEGHNWSIACFDMPDNGEPGNGAFAAHSLPSFHQRVTGSTGNHGRGNAVIEGPGGSGGVQETESLHGA